MAQDLASPRQSDLGTLYRDPKSDSSELELASPRAVVVAPRDLDSLAVETVSPRSTSRILSLRRGESLGAERLRLLRMRLWEFRRQGSLSVLAVTSAFPKDGKSTVALNLAGVLSDGRQHRVLFIEADLHCPTAAANLGLGRNPGLAECLEEDSDPFNHIRRIEPFGWYLLPAGNTRQHPTDLIQSAALPAIMQKLRPHFDWIVIDTPPVIPIPDTISICDSSDAVLLVIRSGVTSKEGVDEAIDMIGANRIASIILNGSEEINKSYYKYSSYYGSKKK